MQTHIYACAVLGLHRTNFRELDWGVIVVVAHDEQEAIKTAIQTAQQSATRSVTEYDYYVRVHKLSQDVINTHATNVLTKED